MITRDEAHRLLEEIAPTGGGLSSRVEDRDRVTVLRISRDGSNALAVIATPGYPWYSLQLDGGFMYDYVDEDIADEEVPGVLERLVSIAVAHLRGNSVVVRSKLLKSPVLVVQTANEQLRIGLSIDNIAKHFFGRRG